MFFRLYKTNTIEPEAFLYFMLQPYIVKKGRVFFYNHPKWEFEEG